MTEHHPRGDNPGYEPNLISTRPLWITAAGMVLLVVVALGLMQFMVSALRGPQPRPGPLDIVADEGAAPVSTPLDPEQQKQRKVYEEHQQTLLGSYGWVDEKQQLVRIPISRAMQLVPARYGKTE